MTAEEQHRAAEKRLQRAQQQTASAEQELARLGYDDRRRRTHALCQIGGAIASAMNLSPIDIDVDRLIAALYTRPRGRKRMVIDYLLDSYNSKSM